MEDNRTEAVRTNEKLFYSAFEASPLGIAIEDLEGQPLFVNSALCSLLGFSEQELLSKRWVEFSSPEDAEEDRALFQQLKIGSIDHYTREKSYLRRDGSMIWARVNISLLNHYPTPLVVAMLEDITEKRAAQEDLQRSEASLQKLADQLVLARENEHLRFAREHRLLETLESVTQQVAAVAQCSHDLRYTWANQEYGSWLQRPLDQIVDRPISEVLGIKTFESLRHYFERVLAGERVTYEQEVYHPGIGHRWVSATYNPTRDESGAVTGWIAVVVDITEQKRTAEALKKSEEKFSKAFQHSPTTLSITSAKDHRYIEVNKTFERITGFSRDETIGRTTFDLGTWVDGSQRISLVERLLAEGSIYDVEVPLRRKDGSVWIGLSSLELIEIDGEPFVLCMIADITERQRAEKALRESEERFRLVANTAPVMIWMSGIDKLCTYFNKPWLDFTGRSFEAELGNGWAEGVYSEDFDRCLETYIDAFDRREPFRMEYRLRRHDGEFRWVLDAAVPRFDADGSFAGYIGSCIDVTERKLAEEAAQKSDERFRLAAKSGRTFAYEWDVATDLIERSGEYAEILGVDEEPRVTRQQSISKVHPDDRERLSAAVAELSAEKPYLQVCARMIRPDGAVIWVEGRSHAYFDDHGRMLRLVGMVTDITERRLAEQALSTVSQRLIEAQEEERTRIARELHDDINQRLALMAVNLYGLAQDPPASPEKFRQELETASKQTADLASDVQALSHRLHSSKLEHLGLAAAAASFCRELCDRQGVEIDFHHENIPRELPQQISLSLFRVLQEALQNSIKHSGSKQFQVSLHRASTTIELSVRDSGIGFDPEEAIKGRGLGLISMKERLRFVNGELSIDSQPQGGTTIHARVPLKVLVRSARMGALDLP